MDDYPADLQSIDALWLLLKSEGTVKMDNIKIGNYKGAIVNP
ncbi:hypothetical protein [Acetivibrio mesophilus]|nr:hypothetical protein [Acetivibrio mesophilus]